MNGLKCVVPENIHTTPTDGICRMAPLPSGFFQNQPPKFTPTPPLRNFQNFCTPPGNIAISFEVNKEVHVVLFARMPNFVTFMYFLLNCITDRQIPYANSLCSQVTNKFCEFHVFSVEFVEKVLGHTKS